MNNNYCQTCEYRNNLTTINGLCLPCSVKQCVICFSDDICTSCSPLFGLFNRTCILCADTNCAVCAKNYSICTLCNVDYGLTSFNNCLPCNQSINNCLTCKKENVLTCLTCQIGRYLDTSSRCILCPTHCATCYLNLTIIYCTSCLPFYYLNSGNIGCSSICGDFGIASDEECDNELGRPYDGCSDLCKVQENFTCFYSNKSVCSYNSTVYIQYQNLFREDDKNEFKLQVKIWPPLYIFTITQQSSLKVLFGLTPTSLIVERVSFNSQFDTLYFQGRNTIQSIYSGETIYINFFPSKMPQIQYSVTPNQKTPIVLETNLIFYVDPLNPYILYMSYALIVLFWLSFILGIVLRKLAGLEAMFVIQIAFLSLVYSNYTLLESFEKTFPLKYSTGYNYQFVSENKDILGKQQQLSPYLALYKLSDTYLLNNFNLNFILQLLALILLVVSYCKIKIFLRQNQEKINTVKKQYIQKRKQEESEQQNQQNQQDLIELDIVLQIYERAHQLMMNVAMVNLTYFAACSSIFFQFGLLNHIPSLLVFGLQALILLFTFIKFCIDPYFFNYFRFSFKPTSLAMHHYFLHILNLLLIVLLLSLLEITWAPLIPVTLMFIYTLAYRPYKQIGDNIRSAFNMLVIMSFLMFRVYMEFICRCTKEEKKLQLKMTTKKWFYLSNLIGLFLVVIISILMSIWYYYKDYLQEQEQKNNRIQQKKKKQYNRRYFLSQLVKLDPNTKMASVNKENTFKKIIEPNKSLLNVANDAEKKEENLLLQMSNERFLDERNKRNKYKNRPNLKKEEIMFKQNQLCEQQLKVEKNQEEKKIDNLAIDVIRSEKIYINLESTMRVCHKMMETEQDLAAASEYDKIDANFLKRQGENKK